MALVKHNNNSISDLTSAGQLVQGKMTLISSQTASGSASIEFTSGIDSSYPIYRFEFISIHPASQSDFEFQGSTNNGSSYGITITSTFFNASHRENDTEAGFGYSGGDDLAQSTSFQHLTDNTINNSDSNESGCLYIFNPSSTTFVKHFMSNFNTTNADPASRNSFSAGYFNSTSPINAFKFKRTSGNIDSGTIKLYGIKGD